MRSSQNFASYDPRRQKRSNIGGSPSPIKMGAMLSSFSAQKNLPYVDESRKANATQVLSGDLQRLMPRDRQNILELHREMEGTAVKGGHGRSNTVDLVERI